MAQNGALNPPMSPKMSKILLIRVDPSGVSGPVILLQLIPGYLSHHSAGKIRGVTFNIFLQTSPSLGELA